MRLYGSQAGWYYFVNDHLGTPQKVVDSSGVVVWQAAYLPFGKAQVLAGSTIVNNFRFPGQYYDAETELHYNWNRYYMPAKGRYLTPDPIGLLGGINLYAYVAGNPTNLSDFFGLEAEEIRAAPGFSRRVADSACTRSHQFMYPEKWGPGQGAENFMFLVELATIALNSGTMSSGKCLSNKASVKLLSAPKTVKHHIFNKFRGKSPKSQKYRDFFKKHNIKVDKWTVEILEDMHKTQIHKKGQNWTTRWKRWIDANPNASTKEVYQFGGKMMDEYGLSGKPLVPYK